MQGWGRLFCRLFFGFFRARAMQALECMERRLNDRGKALLLVERVRRVLERGMDYPLMRAWIALRYRLGEDTPDRQAGRSLRWLWERAKCWKASQPLIRCRFLTAHDRACLDIASRYQDFCALLAQDQALAEQFFLWVLRDQNDPEPFIEFPFAVSRLIACGLSNRLTRAQTALRIVEGAMKDLQMPFEGQWISVVDPIKKVDLGCGLSLSIEEVYAIFAKKEVQVGDVEFMAGGVINWNLHRLGRRALDGSYRMVDSRQEAWWLQMPFLELLDRKKVAKRYLVEVRTGQWVAAATATRGRPCLDFEETHAFLELAIPVGRDLYAIYDFGKLAVQYPKGTIERLLMLTKTVHATVAFPDENTFYTHREKAYVPFVLSEKEGERLMQAIASDIHASLACRFVYQIESENCAKWVHQKLAVVLREKLPDLFTIALLDTEPQGPVAAIFRWIKRLPHQWRVSVLAYLHLPLGSARGLWTYEAGRWRWHSLFTHEFSSHGMIYLPALLIEKARLLFDSGNLSMWVFFKLVLICRILKMHFSTKRTHKWLLNIMVKINEFLYTRYTRRCLLFL